jgi:hypothetical protein
MLNNFASVLKTGGAIAEESRKPLVTIWMGLQKPLVSTVYHSKVSSNFRKTIYSTYIDMGRFC